MSTNVQGVQVPEGATVDLKIEITAQVNITAFVAQQKVTQFVISEISNQLCGEKPDLNIGERLCWSVPVVLTSPAKGTIGRVGEILVDADTGELLADTDAVERIDANAEWLAQRSLFRQEFSYSCVAACVRMVMAHYGHNESEDSVRQLLGTTLRGTRAANVMNIVQLGFDVRFGASNLPQLQAMLAANVPPIIFLLTGTLDYWKTNDAHAVVLIGVDAASVYLNDPFFDIFAQQTPLANFQRAWATTGHLAAFIRTQS